ncbi:hypothetical protein D9V37_04095 [Nocardioides mangrovicus]|uniref:Uncharacterized protein n=1 Tax=Nocardioides mangrovicus TaxID=2478913 RepID=A0A3L8P8N6_9ACTN|nr:hypothetical protein [Nocardioides mangrovicus]RLV51109.1 hypothetical protein D9V37_04095 [Nocardioides mangrovicus]
MGLLGRSLTRRRVAAESARDHVVADSALERSLLSAARVRAAMLRLEGDGTPALSLGRSGQLLYRRLTDATWRITAATSIGEGRSAEDWTLEIARSDHHRATVSTPTYAAIKGALANPGGYDAIRSNLLTAFTRAEPDPAPEEALCDRSLAAAQVRGVWCHRLEAGPVRIELHGTTQAQVADALAQIGLPLDRPTPSDFTWRTGLGHRFLGLRLSTVPAGVVLAGDSSLPHDPDHYGVAALEAAMATWRERAGLFLGELDPDVELPWLGIA